MSFRFVSWNHQLQINYITAQYYKQLSNMNFKKHYRAWCTIPPFAQIRCRKCHSARPLKTSLSALITHSTKRSNAQNTMHIVCICASIYYIWKHKCSSKAPRAAAAQTGLRPKVIDCKLYILKVTMPTYTVHNTHQNSLSRARVMARNRWRNRACRYQ